MKSCSALGVLLTVGLCFFGAGVRGNANVYADRYLEIIWSMLDEGNLIQSNLTDSLVEQFLEIYVPTSEGVKNEGCKRDSERYKQAVKKNQGWALRMLDSGSKIPPGLLLGNVVEMGNYDECLSVSSSDVEAIFHGQHCMVDIKYVQDDSTIQVANTSETTIDTKFLGELAPLLGSKWSVCIPSSCTPHDLQEHLHSVLKDMIGSVEIAVGDDACRSRAHPTVFTAEDWFAIAILTFFAVLVAASTAYDLVRRDSACRSALFVSFSVYSNGRKLLTLSPGSDDLLALHGIRTLSMLWVVVGHSYELIMESPAVNSNISEMIGQSWTHAPLMNYRLAVDSFLLLSGLLLCYGFLKERARGKTFNIGRFYTHRYIRLTPAYAVMILLTATLLDNSDDGPMWRELLFFAQKNCKDNWWTGLLYINNYINPLNSCMDQSWYLSADMQLYLLSPLLLYPLWRWRRVGECVVGFTITAGIITAFTIGWIFQFPVDPDSDFNISEYFPTHARFTPWVMGVALGYYLHTTKNTRPNLSRLVLAGWWTLSTLLLISCIAVNHLLTEEYFDYNRWAEALNSGLNRPSWALGVAWIVFSCSKGYGGFINTILSWKVFQLLSRLTYCVYLVHFALILWVIGSIRTPFYLHDRTMLMVFLYVTVMSFVAALVLSLVFEVPALAIEKLLLDKDTPKEKKTTKYDVKESGRRDSNLGEELVEIIRGGAKLKATEEM